MAEVAAKTSVSALRGLGERFRPYLPGSDIGLALGVVALLSVLILPLPSFILDICLSLSITVSILVLMVALFLEKPLDFSSFPTLLLLTTLLRLALEVATTRLILAHGNEGPLAAGHVVAAFGGFLMGGDVVIGVILFAILLVVNFMVITKGSGRIAEVSARFSLDAMPGKQMAIDADLSAGMIDDKTARRRRRELEAESGFYGAMDGAARFVRGDAIAALIITAINIVGGLAIGIIRHGMPFADAAATFTTLTVGDGLVAQIPALLVSTAAGIVVTKGGMEGKANVALLGQIGGRPKPLALAAGAATVLALMPGLPALPFLGIAGLAGGAAWLRRHYLPEMSLDPQPGATPAAPAEPPISEALRIDLIRLELGYGLLSLASGEPPRLTEQIKSMRRTIAAEMGFVLPPVRIQDNMALPAEGYAIRIKEIEAGRGEVRLNALLAMDPKGGRPELPGERTTEPAFGLPALWIAPEAREEATFRGCTVVDPPSVLATHLTEIVRENMAELLSYSETQKLLDELPREQQKLVADIIPTQISVGGVQRVLQALLAERVSIRDLPTILEGIQEATSGQGRGFGAIVAHVRARLARQMSDSHVGAGGYIPLITLSSEWEGAFADALVGPADDRQLVMSPQRLQEFMQRFRNAFEQAAASGEAPVLLTSAPIRAHVRAIVERIRPATAVLAQTEIHPRARIRTIGTI
jgi:flagellar biosynthesis protein FlhA